MLAYCAYFQGHAITGLVHGDDEIARHASLEGDTTVGHERASEALLLAGRVNSPAVLSMAQLAKGFASRVDDPEQSIEWFKRAAALADTVDSPGPALSAAAS